MTHDEDILWRTLYGEARGEKREGMEAVGCVIQNRAQLAGEYVTHHGRSHPLYGTGSIASACLVPWQFSCWNSPDGARLSNLTPSLPETHPCIAVAQAVLSGAVENHVNGATHYHTTDPPRASMPWPPSWANGHEPVATVGHHIFYNLGMSG